jgi:hypothetical protein
MLIAARRWSVQHNVAELLNSLVSARRQCVPTGVVKGHLFHIAVIIDDIGSKTILVGTLNDGGQVLP